MFNFLRKKEADILRYLPQFLYNDKIFKETVGACNAEHEKIRLQIVDVAKQFFVDTATWGLDDWERVLGITPTSKDSFEYRRNQIKLKIAGCGTSTREFMNKIVNTYGSGHIEEHNERYYFNVYTSARGENELTKMKNDINLFKPAHLDFKVYVGISWNGVKKFDGTQTYSTYTIDS